MNCLSHFLNILSKKMTIVQVFISASPSYNDSELIELSSNLDQVVTKKQERNQFFSAILVHCVGGSN
jgi:hypothetical protein